MLKSKFYFLPLWRQKVNLSVRTAPWPFYWPKQQWVPSSKSALATYYILVHMFWNPFGGAPSVPVLHTLLSFEVFGGSEDSGGWNFDSDSLRNAFMYLRCHYEYCMDQLDTSFAKLAKTDPLSISYADFRLALQEMGISESPLTGSRTDLKHFSVSGFFPREIWVEFSKKLQTAVCFFEIFSTDIVDLLKDVFPNSWRSSFSVTGVVWHHPCLLCCRSYLCWFQPFGCWSHRESVAAQFPNLFDGHLCRAARCFPHTLTRNILSRRFQSCFWLQFFR